MTCHAYLFEVKSIQPFLFATGKLKDMVAGSELIDYLCTGPLDAALKACALDPGLPNPRRAGGAFYLLLPDAERAQRLHQLWPLLVDQLLPGIEQVNVLKSAESARKAIDQGLKELRQARNRPLTCLPVPGPLAERSPRTGEVAVGRDRNEAVDAATAIKRIFRRPDPGLTARFSAQDAKWPNNFENDARNSLRFPLNEDRLVGLVHADGNGLGEILRVLNEAAEGAGDDAYITLYRDFSNRLEQTTCDAAREATEQVLTPHRNHDGVMPARPLVLGGDDLTVIIRADLALQFTEAFILAFERGSQKMMDELREQMRRLGLKETAIESLPSMLTACAGITFMKATQPFAQGYALAESLCARAKGIARQTCQNDKAPIPSTLAFHRVRTTLIEDADSLFRQELQVRAADEEWALGLAAYRVSTVPAELPTLQDLRNLAACFGPEKLNDKPLRSLATLLHGRLNLAQKDYQRWRTLAGRERKSCLKAFDQALEALLGGPVDPELPFAPCDRDMTANNGKKHSPLSDLLDLLVLEKPVTEFPPTAIEA